MVKDARSYSIELPVEFKCTTPRGRWARGRAKLLKVRIGHSGGVTTLIQILEPAEHAGKTTAVDLSDLPISILERLGEEANSRGISFWPSLMSMLGVSEPDGLLRFETVHSDIRFDIVVGTYATTERQVRRIDLEELDTTFWDLAEKNTDTLAAFFRRFGPWSSAYEPALEGGVDDVSDEFEPDPPNLIARRLRSLHPSAIAVIVPEMIWRERQLLGAEIIQANNDAFSWFSLNDLSSRFKTRAEFPHYVLTDHYCRDALRTIVTLRRLRGETYSICARPGCHTPFVPQGKQLKYHHPECGRIVSRAKDRKSKQAATREARRKSAENDS